MDPSVAHKRLFGLKSKASIAVVLCVAILAAGASLHGRLTPKPGPPRRCLPCTHRQPPLPPSRRLGTDSAMSSARYCSRSRPCGRTSINSTGKDGSKWRRTCSVGVRRPRAAPRFTWPIGRGCRRKNAPRQGCTTSTRSDSRQASARSAGASINWSPSRPCHAERPKRGFP